MKTSVARIGLTILAAAVAWLLAACGALQRIEITGSAIRRVDAADGAIWNAWASKDGVDAKRLRADQVYVVSLDLSLVAYEAVQAAEASEEIQKAIKEYPKKLNLRVRPFVIGERFAISQKGDFTLDIDVLKLQQHMLEAAGRIVREGESKRTMSERWGAGRVDVPIMTAAEGAGCSQIVFTVWNETGRKPLDHIVLTLAVDDGESRKGQDACRSGSVQGGVQSILGLLQQEPPQPIRGVLNFFDHYLPDGNQTTTAMFLDVRKHDAVERMTKPVDDGLYVWSPTIRPYDYLRGPMIGVIDNARGAADYSAAATELKDRVFSDRTANGRAAARLAFDAFSAITGDEFEEAWISVRSIGNNRNYFIPLGLLGANGGPLSSVPRVVYPLPITRQRSGACIRRWTVVVPDYLDAQGAIDLNEGELGTGMTRLRTINELRSFFDTDTSSTSAVSAQPEGFLFLGHQAEGQVWFDKQPAGGHYPIFDAVRKFSPGSVAIVAACSVGDAKEGQNSVVSVLNYLGIDTIVATPFPLNADYATELTKAVVSVVKRAKEAKETLTISEVFKRASAIAAQRGGPSYAERPLEFVVLGDTQAKLCDD